MHWNMPPGVSEIPTSNLYLLLISNPLLNFISVFSTDPAMTVRTRRFLLSSEQPYSRTSPSQAIIAFMVQIFFSWRVKVLSDSWILVACIASCSIFQCRTWDIHSNLRRYDANLTPSFVLYTSWRHSNFYRMSYVRHTNYLVYTYLPLTNNAHTDFFEFASNHPVTTRIIFW